MADCDATSDAICFPTLTRLWFDVRNQKAKKKGLDTIMGCAHLCGNHVHSLGSFMDLEVGMDDEVPHDSAALGEDTSEQRPGRERRQFQLQ